MPFHFVHFYHHLMWSQWEDRHVTLVAAVTNTNRNWRYSVPLGTETTFFFSPRVVESRELWSPQKQLLPDSLSLSCRQSAAGFCTSGSFSFRLVKNFYRWKLFCSVDCVHETPLASWKCVVVIWCLANRVDTWLTETKHWERKPNCIVVVRESAWGGCSPWWITKRLVEETLFCSMKSLRKVSSTIFE